MTTSVHYTDYSPSDRQALIAMASKLWKDSSAGELEALLKSASETNKTKIIMALSSHNQPAGFAVFTIRTDYVEGAIQSPTGYLEGIYVEPDYRLTGIAKEMIHIGEEWCKNHGCRQIGSDTWLTDKASRAFHKKAGFWEEDELVHFLKNID